MSKRHLVKFVGTAILITAVVGITCSCHAQGLVTQKRVFKDAGIFPGSGINMDSKQSKSKGTSGWRRNLEFSNFRPDPESVRKFEWPKFEKPNWQAPKFKMPKFLQPREYPKATRLSDEPGFFSKMPKFGDMFPERDPNEPSFFEKASARNKDFWAKTREKFSPSSSSIAPTENWFERTTDSWQTFTRGIAAKFRPESEAMAQPPLRSAQRTGGPRKRF